MQETGPGKTAPLPFKLFPYGWLISLWVNRADGGSYVVTVLELNIIPDIGGAPVRASLGQLRLA